MPSRTRSLGVLRKFGLSPDYYSINTIGEIFTKLKNPIPFLEPSVIYELTCSDRPTAHVGQTGRKLGIRVGDHETGLP